MLFRLHNLHTGLIGRQMFCPYMTKVSFTLVHRRLLIILFNSSSVCSADLVLTSPSLFEILWTCTSTGIAGLLKAYTSTQLAVFLPTPGSSSRLPISLGTCPPNLLTSICETCLMRWALTLKKPMLW